MAYIRPTEWNDPSGGWTLEDYAIDGITTTFAKGHLSGDSWTTVLELTVSSYYFNKIKFYATVTPCTPFPTIKIERWCSNWYTIYEGTYNNLAWTIKDLSGYVCSKLRVSFHSNEDPGDYDLLADILIDDTVDDPDVSTYDATNKLHDRATLHGEITWTRGENASERGFEYKEGAEGEISKTYSTGSFGTGSFSKTPTGLNPATEYYFRAYAINSGGKGYGTWKTFTTAVAPPTVTTQAVTEITHNTGTGNGNITATGGGTVTLRGICWNTTGSPTRSDSKSEEAGSFETGAFTRPITGLDPNVKYYVKAYAYNVGGYSYGDEVDFTTDKTTPTVTTQEATGVLANQVTGNGNIVSTGGENCSERGFEYGLTKVATWSKKEDAGGYTAGAFNLTIDGLDSNKEYWYRAYAINSIGTSYGE